MFRDYEHRADVFREAVQSWADSPRGLGDSSTTEEQL